MTPTFFELQDMFLFQEDTFSFKLWQDKNIVSLYIKFVNPNHIPNIPR